MRFCVTANEFGWRDGGCGGGDGAGAILTHKHSLMLTTLIATKIKTISKVQVYHSNPMITTDTGCGQRHY